MFAGITQKAVVLGLAVTAARSDVDFPCVGPLIWEVFLFQAVWVKVPLFFVSDYKAQCTSNQFSKISVLMQSVSAFSSWSKLDQLKISLNNFKANWFQRTNE